MGESERPSIQSVQRTLIIGVLVGLILGCALGAGLVGFYIRQNPPVYQGGAFPDELTASYQEHYLAMVIDSYVLNPQTDVTIESERLKRFSPTTKIKMLGKRSADYVAAGRGAEAQFINNLAVSLKQVENWNDDTVKEVISNLTTEYQSDPARSQAISTFSAQLLNEVPVASTPEAAEGEVAPEPESTSEPDAAPAEPAPSLFSRIFSLRNILCCLVLIVLLAIIYIIGRRRFEARRGPTKQVIEWTGEGIPPIKQWSGTYTLGQDNYDEFFTIETDEGDFLGESGMGIMDAVPNTSPKQVMSFDVGLFDKTDITTLSRVVMSEYAYNDETIRAKVEANPQAEAVLAEPGKEFVFETSAMRIVAKIDEMAYGGGDNVYFEKLKLSMDLFLKEGADLKKGEMDIPEEYQ